MAHHAQSLAAASAAASGAAAALQLGPCLHQISMQTSVFDCDGTFCAVIDDPLMQVFALDTVQERLDLAEEFGAVPVHGGDRENALKVIKEGTEGRGVDCALEAVGAQPTIKLAFDLIRMGGMSYACKRFVPLSSWLWTSSGWEVCRMHVTLLFCLLAALWACSLAWQQAD